MNKVIVALIIFVACWLGGCAVPSASSVPTGRNRLAPDLQMPKTWQPSHPQNLSTVTVAIAMDPTYTPTTYYSKQKNQLLHVYRCEVLSSEAVAGCWRPTGLFAGLFLSDSAGATNFLKITARLVIPVRPGKDGEFKPMFVDVVNWKEIEPNKTQNGIGDSAEPSE